MDKHVDRSKLYTCLGNQFLSFQQTTLLCNLVNMWQLYVDF
jgi:hypothetical protein